MAWKRMRCVGVVGRRVRIERVAGWRVVIGNRMRSGRLRVLAKGSLESCSIHWQGSMIAFCFSGSLSEI